MKELEEGGSRGPLPCAGGGKQAFVAQEASEAPRPTEVGDGQVWHPTKGACWGRAGGQGWRGNAKFPPYDTSCPAEFTSSKCRCA